MHSFGSTRCSSQWTKTFRYILLSYVDNSVVLWSQNVRSVVTGWVCGSSEGHSHYPISISHWQPTGRVHRDGLARWWITYVKWWPFSFCWALIRTKLRERREEWGKEMKGELSTSRIQQDTLTTKTAGQVAVYMQHPIKFLIRTWPIAAKYHIQGNLQKSLQTIDRSLVTRWQKLSPYIQVRHLP